jgi:hypothetical protein
MLTLVVIKTLSKPLSTYLTTHPAGYTTPRLYRLDCLENMLHFRFLPVAEPATKTA